MADIVDLMTSPRRAASRSGSILKPLNQQRLLKKKSKSIISLVSINHGNSKPKNEEDSWASQIASSIENAVKEKMVSFLFNKGATRSDFRQ